MKGIALFRSNSVFQRTPLQTPLRNQLFSPCFIIMLSTRFAQTSINNKQWKISYLVKISTFDSECIKIGKKIKKNSISIYTSEKFSVRLTKHFNVCSSKCYLDELCLKYIFFPSWSPILMISDTDDATCPTSVSQDETLLMATPKPALSLLQFLQTGSSVC